MREREIERENVVWMNTKFVVEREGKERESRERLKS